MISLPVVGVAHLAHLINGHLSDLTNQVMSYLTSFILRQCRQSKRYHSLLLCLDEKRKRRKLWFVLELMRHERTDPSMYQSTEGVVRLSQTLSRRKENLSLRDRFRPGTRTAHRIRRMLFCSQTFIQAYYRPKEPLFFASTTHVVDGFYYKEKKKKEDGWLSTLFNAHCKGVFCRVSPLLLNCS